MGRSNKLQAKAKANKAERQALANVHNEMSNCIILMTPSSGVCKGVRKDYPEFAFYMSHETDKVYKTLKTTWSVCTAILCDDIVNGRLEWDIEQWIAYNSTYEEIADLAYTETQAVLDKMNPNRRKNIALIFYMGDMEFDQDYIERLVHTDKSFFESTGLITNKDQQRQLKEQIRLLERVA